MFADVEKPDEGTQNIILHSIKALYTNNGYDQYLYDHFCIQLESQMFFLW